MYFQNVVRDFECVHKAACTLKYTAQDVYQGKTSSTSVIIAVDILSGKTSLFYFIFLF